MSGLNEIIDEFYNQAKKNILFYHFSMPVNYNSQQLYQGLNFLILGMNPKTLGDPRWGTLQEFNDHHISVPKTAEVVNILQWKDQFAGMSLSALPVFNVTDTSDYGSYEKNYMTIDLYDFLQTYRIPFSEAENNINSYSQLSNVLYINTEVTDEHDFEKAFPAISRWIVNNYELQADRILKKLNQQILPKFLVILEDLVMFKLANELNIHIKKCMAPDSVTNAISYLYEKNQKSLLLYTFVLADKIISNFISRQDDSNLKKIFLDFMPSDNAYEILKTLSNQEILQLLTYMEEVKQVKDDNTCFLHFYNFDDEGAIDFYVTSYHEGEDEPIQGILMLDHENPHPQSFTSWDLAAEMHLDSMFYKIPVQAVL